MKKLFALKDEKKELYFQIELNKNIWDFLDNIALEIFEENYMIDEHYLGELKDNDYFSFTKKGKNLIIIMANQRAHVVVLGSIDHKKLKEIVFKDYEI